MSRLKYFADIHISPHTCNSLREAGYHVLRVNDVLPSTASDLQIIEYARQQKMVIITQDLDFSALLALTNLAGPSVSLGETLETYMIPTPLIILIEL